MNMKKKETLVGKSQIKSELFRPKSNNSQSQLPIPGKDAVLVCTVGGTGQIGMNWTLYGYDGQWVLVDAGSAFAPREIDGVDAIFPDLNSLRDVLPRLSGLVVTHAHEDHIGAIHRLWPTINCPIYATPFATKVLQSRFAEAGTLGHVKLRNFQPGNRLKVGNMYIDTIRMTHSVPECVGLVFDTPVGKIFHTGDWKFDPHPVVGRPTNMKALQALGEDGVLAMICDSTNADRQGGITSERDVATGMAKVFKNAPGLCVVSCFSTNIARVASIGRAAAATGRQVALSGHSLRRNEEIARSIGLMDGVMQFLKEPSHLKGLDRREMVLICTGAQGEQNASLAKYAAGENFRLPATHYTDTVVHSARVIPGNEHDLYSIFDTLRSKQVRVLEKEYRGSPLHVTGHAVGNEIAAMYEMVRPRFSIPVHGEDHHMAAHADIALTAGVEAVSVPQEGSVLAINQHGVKNVAYLKVDLVAARSGNERGVFVPWDSNNPEAVYDHFDQTPSPMVA